MLHVETCHPAFLVIFDNPKTRICPHTKYYSLGLFIFTLIRVELRHAYQIPSPLIQSQKEGGQSVLIESKRLRFQKSLLTTEEMPSRQLGLEGILPIIFRPHLEVQRYINYWKTLGCNGSGTELRCLCLRPTLSPINHVK